MYSSGLRISEVCHLRYEDIQRSSMRIHIRRSKNRTERFAPLSKFALDILTQYWFECGRPKEWLFPKQTNLSKPIDTFFLSRHIHEHEKRLGWPKRITCHSFRHALGTHLYENGTDLLTIRHLLIDRFFLAKKSYLRSYAFSIYIRLQVIFFFTQGDDEPKEFIGIIFYTDM